MTQAKKKREEKKQARKKKTSLFYMGPTVKIGLLEKGAVFRGEIPKNIKELVEDNPTVKALFVTKDKYVDACKEMKVKGSRMQILYKQALKGGK